MAAQVRETDLLETSGIGYHQTDSERMAVRPRAIRRSRLLAAILSDASREAPEYIDRWKVGRGAE